VRIWLIFGPIVAKHTDGCCCHVCNGIFFDSSLYDLVDVRSSWC